MQTIKIARIALAAALLSAASLIAEKTAPAFELADVNGATHTLAQYAGKVVVLEWTNYDCPFVKKFYSVGAMQQLQAKYREQGVVWLSICSSAPGLQGHFTSEQWQQRIAEQKVQASAVLLDPTGVVGKAYGARTTPHMFVIDQAGKIVYAGGIDDKRSARSADIEGARNYVSEALDALLSGKPIELSEAPAYGCSVKYKE